MSSESINFTINLNGNAYKGVLNLGNAVENVVGQVNQAKTAFEKIGSAALNFDVITNSIGKISQAFQSLVGSSLDFEQQQANLRTLLNGDVEATENLMGKIREYGKSTVYDRSGLVEAQKTMMAFGLDAEFAFGKLKNIGDIALGDSQKMQSLALAFSQTTSTGKLMGQDLMQMINAGFNPLEVISQKTGKSMAQLKDEMSKGAISADMVAQAFEWATEEGGRFYQGAETAAQTTAGKIAKMKDSIDEMKVSLFEATGGATAYIAELGQMVTPLAQLIPVFIGIGKAINTIRTKWSSVTKAVKIGVVKIGLELGILEYSIASAGGMFKILETMAKTACRGIGAAIKGIPIVGWIAAAISAIIGVITVLWKKSEGFRRLVFGVWEAIKAILSNVWTVVSTIFGGVWDVIKSVGMAIADFFTGVWDSITGFVSGLWDSIVSTFSKVINWIVQKLGVIGSWIKEHLVQPIKDAFAGVWDFIKGIFDKILTGLGKLFEPIRTLWNKIFPDDKFSDVSDAYARGAEKGSESWKKDHPDKGADVSVLGSDNKSDNKVTITGSDLTGGNLGSNASTSSGKAQQINITLKSMVETMNFNGGMRENAADVENQLREMMARILGMAATAS